MLYRRSVFNAAKLLARSFSSAAEAPSAAQSWTQFPSVPLRHSIFRRFAATPSPPTRAEPEMSETFSGDNLGKAAASIPPSGKITQVSH